MACRLVIGYEESEQGEDALVLLFVRRLEPKDQNLSGVVEIEVELPTDADHDTVTAQLPRWRKRRTRAEMPVLLAGAQRTDKPGRPAPGAGSALDERRKLSPCPINRRSRRTR